MHIQAHAFQLHQVAGQGFSRIIGHINVDLVQRIPAHPGHKSLKSRLDGYTLQRRANFGGRSIHQRNTAQLLGPVLLEAVQQRFGAPLYRKHPHQLFHTVVLVHCPQIPADDCVKQQLQQKIEQQNSKKEVPGIPQWQLGNVDQQRSPGAKQDRHGEGTKQFIPEAPAGNVLFLIEKQKADQKRQCQSDIQLKIIPLGIA